MPGAGSWCSQDAQSPWAAPSRKHAAAETLGEAAQLPGPLLDETLSVLEAVSYDLELFCY